MIDKNEILSDEFNDKYFYSGSDLGATYTKEQTSFRLWSPLANKVNLFLYDKGYKSKPYDKIKMKKDIKGTWFAEVNEDLHGVFYTYEIDYDKEKMEVVDPYARACGVNGERGMIVDLERTNPDNWMNEVRPELSNATDSIIYETHVRELTIHKTSGVTHNGKFLGLTEEGTRSPEGLKTGLDHLVELGVTHIQLLPVFDFGSIDESKLDVPQYNWGYDPVNFTCIEGSYSTNPIDGEVRIKEFKQMVQKLHENNLRVVMDVDYSHSFLTEEANLYKICPHYFYRHDESGERSNGSLGGSELATERPMVRKFIIESICYLAKEYHIDGFCFNQMGLMDIDTMNKLREALDEIDPSILLYGYGSTASDTPLLSYNQAIKDNMAQMPRIAAFNDDSRDGIRGHVHYHEQPGFVNGGVNMEEIVKYSIVGATEHAEIDYEKLGYVKKVWADQPIQTINFASNHNYLTLYDKIVETTEGLDMDTRIKMAKMANAIVLTSQGIPFILSGEEMLRTKNGDQNSYKSPDMINQIVWNSKYDHLDLFKYYKGLIELRKQHPAFRMTQTEMIQNHLRFLNTPVSNTIAYTITNSANNDSYTDIVVLFNANTSEVKFKLPHFGVWNVVVDGEQAGVEVLHKFTGDEVIIPELTTLVLYSNEKMVNEVTVVEKGNDNLKKYAKVAAGALGVYLLLRRRNRKK